MPDSVAQRAKQCGKVRYARRASAFAALDRIAEQKGRVGRKRPVRAYFCPHCKGWHLTSSAKKARHA